MSLFKKISEGWQRAVNGKAVSESGLQEIVQKSAQERVQFSDSGMHITQGNGRERDIAFSAIEQIDIITTDQGPWQEDVWWCFYLSNEEKPVYLPQGIKGEEQILLVLEKHFAGIDFQTFIMAMGSADNAVFNLWRRA